MANCTVKRTATVTLTLDDAEAAALATVLSKVTGDKREIRGISSVLAAQGIRPVFLGDCPETFVKGSLSWNEEAPF